MLPVLSFDNYSFSYGQNKSTVLKNINLEINTGEIVLIAGHSGCGKSTFLKSINGLIPHMYDGVISGSVNVNGKWLCGECLAELKEAADEAKDAYNKEQYTPKKYKVKNTYNVIVDPITGKLKRGKL